jgi:putative acetyltransferase
LSLFPAESYFRLDVSGLEGLGVGGLLLESLHTHARIVGVSTIRLETGLPQVAAIGLHAKAGYRHIAPFRQYVDDPTGYCMERSL